MIINSMKTLGNVIRAQRRRIPLSQQELADLANVSRTSIQRMEAGIDTTEFSTLLKVLKVLNISINLSGDFPLEMDQESKEG
jgi:transcriptional regulator with XRE-family HTH domain